MPTFRRLCTCILSAFSVLLGLSHAAQAEKVTVAVAANFAAPLGELAEQFEADTGHEIVISIGSTGKIFAQIQQGAPYDLFLAADRARPARLVEINPSFQSATYAIGRLAMVSTQDAKDLTQARIGIADPATAPYGDAAIRALRARGFDPETLDIVNGQNVSTVASYLLSGNIDIGFLAASQRFSSPEFLTDIIDDSALAQDMVLLTEKAAARDFFAYLQSPKVQSALPELGYLPAASRGIGLEATVPKEVSFWPAVRLSLQLASLTTLILLAIGIPIAWWLTVTKSAFRPIVETITALPLVVPPTVLGFYLLVIFAPNTPLGRLWVTVTGETLTFSFSGLLIASVLYSLPFAVQPLHTGFQAVGQPMIEVSQTMGASRISMFWNVILPLSKRGVLTASVLSFAHTIGEFGVVLMVGGNLPGKTRVISVEIFNRVEVLDYSSAHILAGGLLAFSFVALLVIYSLNGRNRTHGIVGGNYD